MTEVLVSEKDLCDPRHMRNLIVRISKTLGIPKYGSETSSKFYSSLEAYKVNTR
jgi:hypothetical protein